MSGAAVDPTDLPVSTDDSIPNTISPTSEANQLRKITSNTSIYDLHPIELTAHTLLSGSLDHLNEYFKDLNQSQVILYTRLKLIENRLLEFQSILDHPASAVIDESQGQGSESSDSQPPTKPNGPRHKRGSSVGENEVDDTDNEVKEVIVRIKTLKKRLLASLKTLKKVETRVKKLEDSIEDD